MTNDQCNNICDAICGGLCDAIREVVVMRDANFEPIHLVAVMENVASGLYCVGHAISSDAAPGTDAAGGHIACLTEAVMGITAGLYRVAEAIEGLKDG